MTDASLFDDRLAAERQRIDALATDPESVGSKAARFLGPVYRWMGWQAKFQSKAVRALLDGLAESLPEADARLDAALVELSKNLDQAERACVVHGYVPTAHASWFYRVADVLGRVAHLAATGDARVLGGMDATRVLPPLALFTPEPQNELEKKVAEEDPDASPPTGQAARLIELELAAIDHIMDAARSETRFIERRRRLFEGARRLLLDANAALRLDPEGATAREAHLAAEIVRLDRLQAAGLSPTVALDYQAKQAARRGDRERLYAALVAVDGFALERGDARTASVTGRALDRIVAGRGYSTTVESGADRARSLSRSAGEIFGRDVVDHVLGCYASARTKHEQALAAKQDPELARLALAYLAPGAETAAMGALVAVDGCFEVGASLAPVRATEIEEHARLVSWPTPELLLVHATEADDLARAVIEDPRTLLLDLAAGRLLTRRYVVREQRPVERIRMVGEARIFVLDGSTSMLEQGQAGSRARMRDAILLAELATMLRRQSEHDRSVRLTLYYRYFTKNLSELVRVSKPNEVLAAMGDVVGTTRTGGTDIEAALVSSFQIIRDAKRTDPDLARASVVLVTDGQAPVDAEIVRRAREEAADVAIAVSVIALGEENPVLRDLVARQRARGERAFYHHVADARLTALCAGDVGRGRSPHGTFAMSDTPERVKRSIEDVLQEIDDLARDLRPKSGASDGALAQDEAEMRDHASLARRYARWFPEPAPSSEATDDVTPSLRDDVEAARVVLASVAEVVGELAGDPMHRKADAIELIERLLPDARLTPARYSEVLAEAAPRLGQALAAVHAGVSGSAESFAHRLASGRPTPGA